MIVQAMLVLFFIVLAIFAIPALRDRITLKLGLRNILRRKGYAAIVIFGLMIGTAVITSSLVVGDTMDNMVESEILKELHLVDETIVGVKPTGEWDYFNTSVFDSVKTQLDRPFIDGLSPSIRDEVPVLDMRTNLSEQTVPLRGVDFGTIVAFGSLIDEKGNAVSGISSSEILVGKKIADELEAEIGDTLMIFANNTPHFFTVAHVLKEKEIAGSGSELFVDLSTAQELFDKEGMINRILISNDGGVKEGMQYTDDVKNAFEAFAIDNEGLTFELTAVKKDLIEENKEDLSAFTDMFLIFGSFSVIAGVILIINIFVMLAEERKSEMGMVRAVGMKRKHLKRMYVSEGLIYALTASFVGVFFGIGIGYLIMFALSEIFKSFGAFNILQYFAFTPASMVIGFVAGFLITIATIYVTAHRISKLNIVRAIREIPEPKIRRSDRRMVVLGIAILAASILFIILGVALRHATPFISGLSLLIFGGGVIARRWVSDRLAFTVVGILILILWLLPSSWFPDYTSDIEIFIVSGLFLVFASLLIVMFNSDQITRVLTFLLGRGKSMQAVLKTAISYSLRSKFRTGMTIAIFGLIIFSITVMSMIVGIIGANIDKQIEEAAGDFDIFGYTLSSSPILDIDEQIANTPYGSKIERIVGMLTGPILLKNATSSGEDVNYQLRGVDDSFIDDNHFGFAEMTEEYENAAAAWNAIRENSSLILIDASVQGVEFGPPASFTTELGATLNMTTADGILVEKKIVGILETSTFSGIFMYNTTVEQQFGISAPNFFLFAIKEGENTEEVAKDLEKTFLRNGMQTTAVKTLVEEITQTMNQFFNLFEAFMGLGLVIGIAGLGIITIRSVHERRQEIGMMRAIGFKRSMVLKSFLIETSFVAIIGIIIGTLLGIFTGYILWRDEFRSQEFGFIINWQPILAVALIALVVTLLCIIPASRKASKIPPAEALRYKE